MAILDGVAPFLAGRGHCDGQDILLSNAAAGLVALAALVRAHPDEQVCMHLLVEHGDSCHLEAWDADFGLDTVFISDALGPSVRAAFEVALSSGL